jgi:threonine dehydratase
LLGCELVIKLETANPIRCFKGRGAEVAVSRLARSPGPKVAVCASAGNLGQALAYSGRARGVGVTVIAGTSANDAKIDRIRRLGAAVELVAGDIENARERARLLEDPLRYRGKRVAVVMCGSNVLSDSFSAWMQE